MPLDFLTFCCFSCFFTSCLFSSNRSLIFFFCYSTLTSTCSVAGTACMCILQKGKKYPVSIALQGFRSYRNRIFLPSMQFFTPTGPARNPFTKSPYRPSTAFPTASPVSSTASPTPFPMSFTAFPSSPDTVPSPLLF